MGSKEISTTPVFNRGEATDLNTAVRNFEKSVRKKVRVCIPACVYEYERGSNVVTVMPLTKFATRQGEIVYEDKDPFTVSLHRMIHGGFAFDIPLFRGDTGWVVSSDFDTMKLRDEGALTTAVLAEDRQQSVLDREYQQEPQLSDFHYLQEGFFIPDSWAGFDAGRCKDIPHGVPDDALYLGTSFDTADKHQAGNRYDEKDSCSLTMERSGKITIAHTKDKKTVSVVLSDGIAKIGNEKAFITISPEGEIVLHGSRIKLDGAVIQ